MPRIPALDRSTLSSLEPLFASVEEHLGVLPNSTLTMAHRPDIAEAFAALNAAVMGPGRVPQGLKQLVVLMVSSAARCNYCQAHTAHTAERRGESAERIDAVWDFEQSPLFDEAERAALRIARGAGRVPNEVTDEEFAELRRHFDDAQVVEIVASIALFGYLNRWNDTMATELEASPLHAAQELLTPRGWSVGKHA
jgi:uncharacterized peroxidase-related enzyme